VGDSETLAITDVQPIPVDPKFKITSVEDIPGTAARQSRSDAALARVTRPTPSPVSSEGPASLSFAPPHQGAATQEEERTAGAPFRLFARQKAERLAPPPVGNQITPVPTPALSPGNLAPVVTPQPDLRRPELNPTPEDTAAEGTFRRMVAEGGARAARGFNAAVPLPTQPEPSWDTRAKGIADVVGGTGQALTPFAIAAAPEAAVSLPAIAGVGTGLAARYGAGKAADALKVSEGTKALAQELAFWAPSVAGGLLGVRGGLESGPEGTRGAASALEGRVGIAGAVTPEAFAARARVGPFEGSVSIPRNGGSRAPALEPPTIEGDAGASMAAAARSSTQAARVVRGLPAVEPPPPAPPTGPPPPPDVQAGHISQETIQGVGHALAKLPPPLRAQGMLEAHQTLANVLLKQGRMVVDGKLELIKNADQANTVAQRVLNDEVSRQDAAAQEAQKAVETAAKEAAKPAPAGKRVSARERAEELSRPEITKVEDIPSDETKIVSSEPIPVESEHANRAEVLNGTGEPIRGSQATEANQATENPVTVGEHGAIHPTERDLAGVAGDAGQQTGVVAGTGEGRNLSVGTQAPQPSTFSKGSSVQVGSVPATVTHFSDLSDRGGPVTLRVKFEKPTKLPWMQSEASSVTVPKRYLETVKSFTAQPQEVLGPEAAEELKKKQMALVPAKAGKHYITLSGEGAPSLKVGVESAEQASAALQLYRDKYDLGGEAMGEGSGEIFDPQGKLVGHVSYNGRVWPGDAKSWKPGTKPLQEAYDFDRKFESESAVLPERASESVAGPSKVEEVAKPVAEGEKEFKYRSTQVNIPAESEAHHALEAARGRVSESDLAGKGKDVGGNHLTVKYGLKAADDDKLEELKTYIASLKPFEASLGRTEKFEPTEHSEGAAVIQAPVNAPQLHEINKELEKHGDFKKSDFGEYKPHATIAYVKPEAAGRYVGMSLTHGAKFPVNSISITDRDGKQEEVKLEGKKPEGVFPPRREITQHGFDHSIETGPDIGQQVRAEKPPLARGEVAPGKVGEMATRDLHVAPHKFQYKLSTDAEGVSTLLKDTKVYNPDLANVISVWRDPTDGKFYTVNGHHRYELAKRTGQKTVTVRHIVASDATAARAIGAMQNIAEGRGTAIDAAKFLRDTGTTVEDFKAKGISLGEKTAADGLALSKLDLAIFSKVVAGDVRIGRAVAIGEATDDHAEQKAILSLVERKERGGAKVSDGVLSELIRLVKGSGKAEETTADLFGSQQITRSLALEKAEISDYIKSQLAKDKKLFGFVAKEGRATELARAGNKIDVEKSREISSGAAQAEEVYNKLSSRGGPISTVLDEAAARLADGDNGTAVKSDVYQRIRAEVSKTLGQTEGRSAERPEGAPATNLFSPEETKERLAPPFYQKAARVAFEKLPNSGTGSSMLSTLRNAGVKEDEIKWMGLDDFLGNKFHVKKADVLKYIMANLVGIREISKSGISEMVSDNAGGLVRRGTGETKYVSYTLPGPKKNYTEVLLTLPTDAQGGAAMREAGQRFQQAERMRESFLGAGLPVPGDVELKFQDAQREMQKLRDKQGASQFKSSHFEERNILAHVRFDERTDADGKPILLVEEVQSDWAQKGKRSGYAGGLELVDARQKAIAAEKTLVDHGLHLNTVGMYVREDGQHIVPYKLQEATTNPPERRWLIVDRFNHVMMGAPTKDGAMDLMRHQLSGAELAKPDELTAIHNYQDANAMYADAQRTEAGKVPAHPFPKDWHELAMKTMLRKAAEGGYDKLAWVTGAQTAERYDLSKQVSKVEWEADTNRLIAFDKEGNRAVDKVVPKEQLADYIGKDAAEKLVNGAPRQIKYGEGVTSKWHELEGQDLKVGGKWADALYDRAIPNFLSKYGKKFGAKIGTSVIPLADMPPSEYEKYPSGHPYVEKNRPTVHSIEITPEMKQSVLYEGQPLFRPATGPIQPGDASKATFDIVQPKGGLPGYLRLSPEAMMILHRAVGVRFGGVSLAPGNVGYYADRVAAYADDMERKGMTEAAKRLTELSHAMVQVSDSNDGLTVVRADLDPAREADVVEEELLHAAMQRRPGGGNLEKGVPVDRVAQNVSFRRIGQNVAATMRHAGINPTPDGVAAEVAIDLVTGQETGESDADVESATKAYFEALVEQSGIKPLNDALGVLDYAKQLREQYGITADEPERRAVARKIIEDTIRAGSGKETTGSSGTVQTGTNRGELERGRAPGTEPDLTRSELGQGTGTPERTPAFAAATPGLTDEELAEWAKSKGFRSEPAGEQLSMFGDAEPVMRVFRAGAKGKEQSGLVYQSQLEKVSKSAAEPEEPFALTGGEEREEQPRLFGAGDLGEIIGPRPGEKPSTAVAPKGQENLFSGEKGELEPGRIGEVAKDAAGVVKSYLKSTIAINQRAKELQHGFYELEGRHAARSLEALETAQRIGEDLGKSAATDYEQIYHHREDPENNPLTPKQDELLDDTILPIMDEDSKLYQELKDGGLSDEALAASAPAGYIHREVKGKNGPMDRIVSGARSFMPKNMLSQSAPQTKGRVMFAAEPLSAQGRLDEQPSGRRVVSVKNGQVTAWKNGQPENMGALSNPHPGQEFEGSDGRTWKLTQATTKEIEKHTDLEYHKNALASVLLSHLQLSKAVDAMRFVNTEMPKLVGEGLGIKRTDGPPPEGFRASNLPQAKGYYWDSHVAEVFDWYNDKLQTTGPSAFDQIGSVMRAMMLLNPLVHPKNILANWTMEQSPNILRPWKWVKMAKAGNKAVAAVWKQNADYRRGVSVGGPLMSHQATMQKMAESFFESFAAQAKEGNQHAARIAEMLGLDLKQVPVLGPYKKLVTDIAWMTNDLFFLQSSFMKEAEGMDLRDGVRETARYLPDYRIPTRVLNSAKLAKILQSRELWMFSPYHVSQMRVFPEMAKGMFGLHEPPPGAGGKGAEAARAWTMLGMTVLMTYVMYGMLADYAVKKLTGDEKAKATRSGIYGLVDHLGQVARGEMSVGQFASSVLTPNILTRALIEGILNFDFGRRRAIYDPHASWSTIGRQFREYLIDQAGQVGQGYRAAQSDTAKHRFWWGQAGVSFPKSRAEKIAGDIRQGKMGTAAADPDQMAEWVDRRDILDALRKGDSGPLSAARTKGEFTAKQAEVLRKRARLTPLQDAVHGFDEKELGKVNDVATPKERAELERITRMAHIAALSKRLHR
jgi:2'-5' RNA ligase